MIFKKNMWWGVFLLCLLVLVVTYYRFSNEKSDVPKDVKSLQNTIKQQAVKAAASITMKKAGILFEDNMEDGNFVLPPKLKQKNREVIAGAAFKSVPRDVAQQDAEQAISAIGEDVPPEWIAHELKNPNSALSVVKKQIAGLPTYTPESLKKKIFELHALYEYQREMLSKNKELSWQGSEISGWKLGTKYFKTLATLLDNQQYEAMLGVKKNSVTAVQMTSIPHPYDDTTGPSSEAFATLPIRRSTHGLIKTEEELFQYVDPGVVSEVTNLYKTAENEQRANQDSYEKGEITDDERIQFNQEIFHQTTARVKVLLTPEQGRLFGLESLWEEDNVMNQ